MMIKLSSGYLDFVGDIEVEKQIKLFEDLSTTDGDFSYVFHVERTANNIRLLQNPFPDVLSKPVYQQIPATLQSDDGAEAYNGYLRIEKVSTVFECSFFSGNNNWFGMLSGPMSEIDWSSFDTDQTEGTLSMAIFNTSGVVFPFVDNGVLAYRGANLVKVEDFVGAIFTKDIVKKIFTHHSIKLEGELLDDPDYMRSVTLRNGKSSADIDSRSIKVHTTNSPNPSDATYHKMVWTNDSTYPYFGSDLFDLSLGRYTADAKMKVRVNLNITQDLGNVIIGGLVFKMAVYINGVLAEEKIAPFGTSEAQSYSTFVTLENGDYLEIFTYNNALIFDNPITNATLELAPIFIYRAFGSAMVPNWTQAEYVSEILRHFNVLSHFNATTQTLTLNLFERLKDKEPLDLSPYISSVEADYVEFISAYGKKSIFSHQETSEEEEFKKLNPQRRPYSTGFIEVNNEFLEDEVDVLESKFSAPITYLHPVFQMSLEKTNLVELEEDIKIEFSAVTDNLGRARFAIPEDVFELSDMVRVTNSTNSNYNGDYMVITLGSGYIELEGLAFDTDAFGEVTKMNFVYSSSDQVYLLHHVPLYAVNKFSGLTSIQVENTDYEHLALGFYNPIATGRDLDTDFVYSMAFEPGDMRSVIDRNYNQVGRMLQDPVKLICDAYLPYKVFRAIDFLRPTTIKTEDTSNQYYVNKISGYDDTVIELIKL